MFNVGDLVDVTVDYFSQFNPWTVLRVESNHDTLLASPTWTHGHSADGVYSYTKWEGRCWFVTNNFIKMSSPISLENK